MLAGCFLGRLNGSRNNARRLLLLFHQLLPLVLEPHPWGSLVMDLRWLIRAN